MALLPIRFGLKLGDWTIFAGTMFERDEEAKDEAAPTPEPLDFGFAPPSGDELLDQGVEVVSGR